MENLSRWALHALIVSVTISGFLGAMAILGGGGALQERILGTTSTISVASLCSLSCAALWDRKKRVALPATGVGLTLLGALLVIIAIWADGQNDVYVKIMLCVIVFAVACSHLSLLSLAQLSDGFRWSLGAAYVADLLLAGIISALVIDGSSPNEFELRVCGILSIGVASLSILIPIFHRLSARVLLEEAFAPLAQVLCPCCGARRAGLTGDLDCAECGCVFVVKRPGNVPETGGNAAIALAAETTRD